MKIEKLLIQPEGKTLEFKQDISSPKNILKTLIAFANTAGGIVKWTPLCRQKVAEFKLVT
ncbi:MAG: ATP-binding protein, partial [Chlorobium sp.]